MGPQKFIAANTADALKLIRAEMGPDAMVLSTKDTDQGVEVMAITSGDLATLSSRAELIDTERSESNSGELRNSKNILFDMRFLLRN